MNYKLGAQNFNLFKKFLTFKKSCVNKMSNDDDYKSLNEVKQMVCTNNLHVNNKIKR